MNSSECESFQASHCSTLSTHQIKTYSMFPVALPEGPHPFPSRTRKLSPPRSMILLPRGSGKVERCRVTTRSPLEQSSGLFYFSYPAATPTWYRRQVPILRELIERGGTSKLGLDLCRVTKRSLLVKASRLSCFLPVAAFGRKSVWVLSGRHQLRKSED